MVQQTKLDKIKNKRIEIKENYNAAKAHRSEIVNSINELDDKIKEIDDKIQEYSQNLLENHVTRIKNNKLIKFHIISAISQWSLVILITSIINQLSQGSFIKNPIGIITTGITTGMLNFIQYKSKANKTGNRNKSKIKYKNLEDLEQQRKKLIEERITKGTEYKQARGKEVLREKIYKELDPILETELVYILEGNDKEPNQIHITTKDIYHKIKVEQSFYQETAENQKSILDDKLKEYISSKISEIYQGTIGIPELSFLSTEDLVKILIDESPRSQHQDIISNIIHAILNFSGLLQEYSIVWHEEKDISLINEPKVIFDEEGKWIEYKTHKNTNYYYAFQIVYHTFINNVMDKNQSKKRTKSN